MESLKSVKEIDLSPKPGKVYFNIDRSWSQEIIYFLMVDRFHDSRERRPMFIQGRSKGFGKGEELNNFYGGTIKGITNNLDYIKELGCTAIWITPVFENNPTSYHGYAIQNFLQIDPRFGSKPDLEDLVDQAHRFQIKVILDVVINHTGDNWHYYPDKGCTYSGTSFRFGGFRKKDRPLPVELQNGSVYFRKGSIQNWDKYPETIEGDFFNLKKLRLDETEIGVSVLDLMVKVYSFWIKECDFDGFRIDAAKHVGPFGLNYFTRKIKEYAIQLGKKDFFVMAELTGDHLTIAKYSNYKSSSYPNLQPPDSFLDFPLHYILPSVLKGKLSVSLLWDCIKSFDSISVLTNNKLSKVTFLDNHDQIALINLKERIGADLSDEELIGAVGLLFSMPGIPCIYYGTEQGLKGKGDKDYYIRESMFSKENSSENILNPNCIIYKKIKELSKLRISRKELSEGGIISHSISIDGKKFKEEVGLKMPIVFSREWKDEYTLVIFNIDKQTNEFYIDLSNVRIRKNFSCVFGEDLLKEFTETEKSGSRVAKVTVNGSGLIILNGINF